MKNIKTYKLNANEKNHLSNDPVANIKIIDNKLYRTIPIDEDINQAQLVITKEEFQKCYNKWIAAEE